MAELKKPIPRSKKNSRTVGQVIESSGRLRVCLRQPGLVTKRQKMSARSRPEWRAA